MSADAARRQRVGSALRLAGFAIALTALVVLAGWALASRPAPTATAPPTAAAVPSTASPSVAPSMPAMTVLCTREPWSPGGILASDPCPSAAVAVQLTVAAVRLPIERIVIEPGPFYCDVVWPGVGSPRVCSGYAVRPGQFMHAWVAFHGSDEMAAVMLGLDLPDNLNEPGATRPPWLATLVTVEVPPAGWVMP